VRQSQGPTFRRLPKDEPVPLPFAVQLVAYHAPKDSASVQYAELLETIVDAAQAVNKSSKILGFTAVRAGVGCTTVVLNLAISAAMQGKRVIVVDANLRDSAVAKRLGMSEHPGLTELLAGVATLTEVLRETGLANLQVLTSGTPAPLWADRRTLTQTLEKIGQNADLVFIDAPTQQDRAADLVAGVSEATFLVVPQNEAETENTGALLESLPLRGLPLAGCIVTQ
jgi:Mrp family chromosome partitioning ATPase